MRQELQKEKRAYVAKFQKEQVARKMDLVELQEVAQRKSTQDLMVYNGKVDAEERRKQQFISKRNRDIAVFNNKVKELFTFQPGRD